MSSSVAEVFEIAVMAKVAFALRSHGAGPLPSLSDPPLARNLLMVKSSLISLIVSAPAGTANSKSPSINANDGAKNVFLHIHFLSF